MGRSPLGQLAAHLEVLGEHKGTREELVNLLHLGPVGLGAGLARPERRDLFVQGFSHGLDWSPALLERWRRTCALAPSAFFRARPFGCDGRSWRYPTCACTQWRRAAQRLLWVGGGLTLETFEETDLDARVLMFDLYPPTVPGSVGAAFGRTTSGHLANEALALWGLGPWEEGAIARRTLARTPPERWTPLVEAILISGSWNASGPGESAGLLRRLSLMQQIRLVTQMRMLWSWAAFNRGVIRALGKRNPDSWTHGEFSELVELVMTIASTEVHRPGGAPQQVVDAARQVIPKLGRRGAEQVLQFMRSSRLTTLPDGMVASLLQYPDERIRAAALQELAVSGQP